MTSARRKEPETQASEEAKAVEDILDRLAEVWPIKDAITTPDEAAMFEAPVRSILRVALDRVSGQALERAAKAIEAECARVLGKQTAGKCDPRYEDSVNLNLRMMAVLLPDIAASVRALIPGGK